MAEEEEKNTPEETSVSEKTTMLLLGVSGTLIVEEHELEGTLIGPQTKPDEILAFVARAIEQNPLKFTVEVGKKVRVWRPVKADEVLASNALLAAYAAEWAEANKEFVGNIRMKDKDGKEYLKAVGNEPDGAEASFDSGEPAKEK